MRFGSGGSGVGKGVDASIEGLTLRDNECDHCSLRLFRKRRSNITSKMGSSQCESLVNLVITK